ncbi:endonuclease/exonuclease/phosphatase family protein, partial [candidate division KSB1 bacterium]|nr:endonuclease/exonuclease/phosphatase family protein [candidate division KSB1 bacterium]
MRKFDFAKRLGGAILLLSAASFATIWLLTFHPDELQTETVTSPDDAPLLQPGQKLKILTWNVQFMAGKNYVFWHDTPNFDGPHERPSSDDIAHTLAEVSRVIREENPDIVLLQEVDDGGRRTDHEDQLARLLAALPPEYSSHVSAFYWRAAFVPHPRILGSVGMKLSTISKYKISHTRRHQLALPPNDIITRQFSTKRAFLEARLPLSNGAEFVVLNTHLDAFAPLRPAPIQCTCKWWKSTVSWRRSTPAAWLGCWAAISICCRRMKPRITACPRATRVTISNTRRSRRCIKNIKSCR